VANPLLLAIHITIAIALTITVGVQSAELARLRTGPPKQPAVPTLRAAVSATPILAILTFITGFAVIADHGRGGPWVGAGVMSTLIIGLASVWLRRRLRRDASGHTGVVGAVQWGVPAMTLAAAFLMADRPQNASVAFGIVLLAAAVTVLAYITASRSATA
jgi:ABC-type Fe3+ transport system permease subunit